MCSAGSATGSNAQLAVDGIGGVSDRAAKLLQPIGYEVLPPGDELRAVELRPTIVRHRGSLAHDAGAQTVNVRPSVCRRQATRRRSSI